MFQSKKRLYKIHVLLLANSLFSIKFVVQTLTHIMVKEVTVHELKKMLDENKDFQLIDVREEFEYDTANIGGELIPLGNIMLEADKIEKDKQVVIHCRSGARSAAAIMQLEKEHGFTNLYNLKGGILAWIAMNETQAKA